MPAIKWFGDFEKALPTMTGKRIAITGTTSGTGFIAARTCANKGAEVFLLNRASERSTKCERELRQMCPNAVFHTVACDLMNLASVRSAAKELSSLCSDGLDVLCCNAGIMMFPDEATADGFDVQMQTNHLSHFLLVKEMMPALRAAAASRGEARIVNHSSFARFGDPLMAKYMQKQGGDLGGNEFVGCMARYQQSKLANLVFTYALADRLAGKKEFSIKAVCAAPGFAATSLFNNLEGSGSSMPCRCIYERMLGQSAEDGTMPLLTAILGDAVESGDMITPSRGSCFGDAEFYGPVRINKQSKNPSGKYVSCEDRTSRDVLWKASNAALGEPFVI